MMDPELRDLLRAVAIDTTADSHTHVSLYGPQCRWTVRSHSQAMFWSGYCDLVDQKTNGRDAIPPDPFANLCLAERPQTVIPAMEKFTFRFHADDEDWEPYDDGFLMSLCQTYQTVLAEHFRLVTETQMELVVAVFESSTHWIENDREKNERYMVMEVKIQFPYARIDSGIHGRHIRPRFLQLLRNNNVMSRMRRQPIGDWETIICSTIATDPIVLYGSSETPERPKLELGHIWPRITDEIIEDGEAPEILLADSFVPTNHMSVQHQAISPEIFSTGKPLRYWLPLFFSVGYWPTVLLPKTEYTTNLTGQIRNETFGDGMQNFGLGPATPDLFSSDIELSKRMISFLRPERFLRESFWLDIGKALHRSDNGGENGILA